MIGFIKAYITRIVVVALLTSLGVSGIYNFFQHRDIKSLHTQLQTYINKEFITNTNLLSAQRTIKQLNNSITLEINKSKKLQTEINSLSTNIIKIQKQDNILIQKLKNAPVPKNCITARKFLQNQLGTIQW